jgi:chromosome segregation ATPase
MTDKKAQPKKVSLHNTKQQMLDAYNELLRQLQEKQEADVKPEERIEEKTMTQAVKVADALSTEGVVQGIGALKSETGKLLNQLSDRLEEEIKKYQQIQTAVAAKEKELHEIYEMQRAASSLTALIEAQHQQRQAFDAEMAGSKDELQREIQSLRAEWEKEKKLHEVETQEQDAAELKRREREKEEYLYAFRREQQLAQDRSQDEKVKLEREVQYKKEQLERVLAEREAALAQREEELSDLRKKGSLFPKELESAVTKAVKEAVDKLQAETKSKEELLKREFEGERNVLQKRIESLEKTVKEQNEQLAKLSQHLEKAYGQVQEIAIKALEGSSSLKLTSMQPWGTEPTRKPVQEK